MTSKQSKTTIITTENVKKWKHFKVRVSVAQINRNIYTWAILRVAGFSFSVLKFCYSIYYTSFISICRIANTTSTCQSETSSTTCCSAFTSNKISKCYKKLLNTIFYVTTMNNLNIKARLKIPNSP